MPGSDLRTVTAWQTVSRFYRRPPGRGWWLALVTVPLLLALIGYGITDRPAAGRTEPVVAGPALTTPAEPEATAHRPPGSAVVSVAILRNGDVVTLNGELPDGATRTALLTKLTGVFGPQVRLVDNLNIKPGVAAPDIAGLAALFQAGINMADLKFQLNRGTLTLTGTAAAEREKAAVDTVVRNTWPAATIRDEIRVRDQAPGRAHPSASHTTPDFRAKNRRVVIVVN